MLRVKNNSSSGHVNVHVIQVAVVATLAALGYGSETPNVTTPEFNETSLKDYETLVMSLCVEIGAYICVVMDYIYDFLQNFVALTDLQLRELGELKLGFVMTSILFVFLIVMMVWKLLLRGRLRQQDLHRRQHPGQRLRDLHPQPRRVYDAAAGSEGPVLPPLRSPHLPAGEVHAEVPEGHREDHSGQGEEIHDDGQPLDVLISLGSFPVLKYSTRAGQVYHLPGCGALRCATNIATYDYQEHVRNPLAPCGQRKPVVLPGSLPPLPPKKKKKH